LDQQVAGGVTLFTRYSRHFGPRSPFDLNVSFGGELAGHPWRRPQDGVGVAVGFTRMSRAFRRDAPLLDANGGSVADFGYAAASGEKTAEAYYRYQVNDTFALAPDIQ